MKVIITQSDLLEGLKTVSRAVSGQNTLPVLGNILIRAEGKKVFFSATNLEISIATSIEANIQNEGTITIPAKILTAYTSLLEKDQDIELKLVDGLALSIKSKSSKTKIKGISAEEFPSITRVESGEKLVLSSKDFRSIVQEIAFSAQENASRPILSGVLFKAHKKQLNIVATDSYRLSEKIITLDTEVDNILSIVPVRAIFEADRLAATGENITITISENQVSFGVGGTELVSRLIEGEFPDYQQIIPKAHKTTIFVDRKKLALAVRRVSIFAKENNHHMKLEFLNDGTLTVSTDQTEIGEGRTTVPIKIEGDTNIIALNTDYVQDILSALSGEEQVRIELEGKLNPAVFKLEKDENFLHLIMPQKI